MALSLLQRFTQALNRLNARRGYVPNVESPTFDWDWDERRDNYTRWESLYANSIYLSQQDGGYREIILSEDLGVEDTTRRVDGYYNPVGCIVDTYQNVFRGLFGREILISETATETAEGAKTKPVNEKIIDPLYRIFRWSNINDKKEELQYWCALNGCVGLRVEGATQTNDGSAIPVEQRKIRIRPIHPREIKDYNEDSEGNITEVLLEYSILEGQLGERRDDEPTTYTEYLGKDSFWKKREEDTIFNIPNALGLCPFVLLKHTAKGPYGMPSHFGTERQLHLINWLLTRTSISVDRHVFAKWLAAASGAKPETFEMDDTTVAYVQMGPGDTRPMLEAVVAKLDFIGIERLLMFFIQHLRQRQPELVLSALEAMSGQSGETISKLLIPVEDRIVSSRSRYEHALIRAGQIGLSLGIVNGLWDIGTGMDASAADEAYRSGAEDFRFNKRSALPETVFDEINRAKAENARTLERANVARALDGIVDQKEKLKIVGYTDSEAQAILTRLNGEDVTNQNTL